MRLVHTVYNFFMIIKIGSTCINPIDYAKLIETVPSLFKKASASSPTYLTILGWWRVLLVAADSWKFAVTFHYEQADHSESVPSVVDFHLPSTKSIKWCKTDSNKSLKLCRFANPQPLHKALSNPELLTFSESSITNLLYYADTVVFK